MGLVEDTFGCTNTPNGAFRERFSPPTQQSHQKTWKASLLGRVSEMLDLGVQCRTTQVSARQET